MIELKNQQIHDLTNEAMKEPTDEASQIRPSTRATRRLRQSGDGQFRGGQTGDNQSGDGHSRDGQAGTEFCHSLGLDNLDINTAL